MMPLNNNDILKRIIFNLEYIEKNEDVDGPFDVTQLMYSFLMSVIQKCEDTGLYVGHVPDIPGAHSQGETHEEPLANLREISWGDYYFGKSDAFRITLGKNWHVKLTPPPKTPGAEREELWHIGYVDRSSGVRDVVYGWEGIPALRGG